ncbi:MAG: adenylosuccinate synthase [Verrucomicrobium sp.]
MQNTIIIGAQWGDEGKGKIVDLLSAQADRVIRFNGGNNAGHTLVAHGQKWKLSLLPCGLLHGRPGVIGSGVVVDPEALFREMETLERQGVNVSPDQLTISDRAVLVLPVHRLVEAAEEARRRQPIGTTLRGIGPALQDKAGRRAVRICDLADPVALEERLDDLLSYHNALLRGWGEPAVEKEPLLTSLLDLAPRLLPFVADVGPLLEAADSRGERLLFEGAQAVLLDVDHGTFPYVTSSHTGAAQAALGTGYGPATQASVLGVCKTYATRVGNGPFPTELTGALDESLRERGGEYGVNTGRPRRCGWFDAVMVRHAIRAGGIQELALTKLDVLDDLAEIKIATGYRINGKLVDAPPASWGSRNLAGNLEPVYETLPGWRVRTAGTREFHKLPVQAREYVQRIEVLTEVPVRMVSTGADREDTMVLKSDG